MRTPPTVLALLLVAILAGCKSTPRSDSASTNSPLQLEWHLASDKPHKDYVEMTFREGQKVMVNPQPILRLSDISNAARSTSGDSFLYLNVKVPARAGLQTDTGSHVKDLLALLLNGQVVYVATLQSSLSRQVPVRIGAGGITEAEATEIIDAIRQSGGK